MARRIVIVVALLVGTVAVGAASPAPSAADGNEAPGAPLAQRSLAVSEAVTCLRFPDGRTKCLGSNEFGAVGQGANGLGGQADAPENQTGADLLPIVFPGGHTPVSISSGFHDVCAVLDDGEVSCWGNNGAGQLGIGSTLHKGSPQAEIDLGTGRTATAVAVGIRTVCAVLDDGSVKCWGAGTSGVLGQGDGTNRGASLADLGDALLPVPLGTGRTATAVAVGSTFACAVLDDGSVRCWGENGSGQLGQGDTTDRGDQPGELGDALPPIPLGTGRTATAITAGDEFACALLDDGSVKCWGNNVRGQLGVGDTANRGDQGAELGDALPSVPLGTGRTATAVTAGAAHACARLDDATVRCWGYNNVGQLGQGGTDNRGDQAGELGDALPAIALGTGRTATAVSAGGPFSCALLDDGAVKCWGAGVGNAPGEMGDALGPRLFDGNGISGRVTSSGNGVNALVVVLDPNDFHLEVVDTTNTSGYLATSVPAGDHYLYVVPKSGFTYGFHGPPTLITVAGGHTTVADPTVAPTTGVIAGTVRDATTHDPVGGALTVLLDGQTGAPRRFVKADAAGAFQFAGLAPGNWFVGALDPAGAHQTAFYPGVASVPAASHVTVTAGGTAAADLDLPAQPVAPTTSAISGRVTESGTGTALSGIVVLALSNSDFSFERAATTSNTGNYNLYVPAGSHRVALVDPTLAHPMEWFEDQPYAGIAASTPVTSPAVVDATLTATTGTSALTGTVRDLGATKSGVWVLVIGNQGIAAVATTGSGGTYAVAGLAPGNYWLAAIDPGTDRLEYVPDATAIADAALHAAPADRTVVVDISLR